MITRIEIDGFKSFRDFAINLRPFQVLIGANGSGKSNLFDAIALLSHLAQFNLVDAFREIRGDIGDLFSLNPDGTRVDNMRFAVEVLIGMEISDQLGITKAVSSTRLRYEIQIQRKKDGYLQVISEKLSPIDLKKDPLFHLNGQFKPNWFLSEERDSYLSVFDLPNSEGKGIVIAADQGGEISQLENRNKIIERSVLSTITSATYPTAFAMRQEMLSWRIFNFNPECLREPNYTTETGDLLQDGSNLAAFIYRMQQENEYTLTDISLKMANLVPGLLEIALEEIKLIEQIWIKARLVDTGDWVTSRLLSDGTLRLLALVALYMDSHQPGLIAYEEPENGVHPQLLEKIVKLLKSLVTDPNDEDAENKLPRQVLVNTHSPQLLSYIDPEDVLFVYMPGRDPRRTRMSTIGVQGSEQSKPLEFYTIDQIRRYLDIQPLQQRYQELSELRNGKI